MTAATRAAAGMAATSPRAPRQDPSAGSTPMIVQRIYSLALILTLSMLSHNSAQAFTPSTHLVYFAGSKSSPSSSQSFVPTQLLALQPSKGGIIVEAKSDYVARDILIDGFMGRDSTSSSGEKELGWKEPRQDLDLNDNFAPNESSWLQSPNSRRMGQQVQQQQPSQFQSASGPVPPSLPPLQVTMQPQQQQHQFPTQQQPLSSSSTTRQSTTNSTGGNTKSKLPDPSLMKLSDIQGELSLRRIVYNDCFDRTSLEAKLREARIVMTKTASPPTTTLTRASPAEQAIFSPSFAGTKSATSATSPSYVASSRRAAPNSASSSSPSSSNRNPFRRQSGVKKNNNRGGQNSSSSFRDNSHGIGFGDANSYYSSVGPSYGGSSRSGGDGVRLGKQRTSYGEFGGSSTSGRTSLGGSSVSGGGSTSIFHSSGGGVGSNGGREIDNSIRKFGSERKSTPFYAGGMSIKGDSSIFSSAGFVGQQGTVINAFSERDGRRSTSSSYSGVCSGSTAMSERGVTGGSLDWSGELPLLRSPVTPTEEPLLGWLRQDPPGNKYDFTTDSVLDPAVTNYDASSYYDENSLENDALLTSYNSGWISQQYQEQGLDFLSGGQEGFGAVKGIETSGGDSNIIPPPKSGGGPGNTGVTMGGDFAHYGNSNVGGRQLRSSARYSGGSGGFDGMDCED